MKNLLIITLLFSSFGYSSFNITKFSCTKFKGEMKREHYNLRVDEERKKIRLNMHDEVSYEVKDFYLDTKVIRKTGKIFSLQFTYNQILWLKDITPNSFHSDKEYTGYRCKII